MLSSTPLALAIFILGFGFLVFVHELGHFLVARLFGVRCTQFAIGFGNALLTWRKGLGVVPGGSEKAYYEKAEARCRADGVDLEKLPDHEKAAKLHAAADALGLGETEYRLNVLPLGGYVKMVGQEDLDPDARSSDPRAYNNKPIAQRMGIISAGVVMNLIFGVLFFVVAFMIGVELPASVVGRVAPGSPAATTYAQGHEGDPGFRGLRTGDTITAIDGKPIRDMVEVRVATALGDPEEAIALTVQRPGVSEPLTFDIQPDMRDTVPGEAKMLSAGIFASPSLEVAGIARGTAVDDAGVEAGMTVAAVDGEAVGTYAELIGGLADAAGRPVAVTFSGEEGGATVELRATPTLTPSDDGVPHLLGFVPATRVGLFPEDRDSAARDAGVRPGDVLARVGDASWPAPSEVPGAVQAAGDRVEVAVVRGGERVTIGPITPRGGLIGITMQRAQRPFIARTRPDSPAAALSLPAGSEILAVDGEPVSSWGELQAALADAAAAGGDAVTLEYRLNLADAPVATDEVALDESTRDALLAAGWAEPAEFALASLDVTLRASNPIEALALGAVKTKDFVLQTYLTLRRLLVEQTVKVSHLRGPAGIVDEGQRIAQRGWAYLLFFLGLISVNLAVINFLPFPILDGGHMVFLAVEKVKGSPPSPLVINIATYAALAVIATLFLVITYHDLVRIGSRLF